MSKCPICGSGDEDKSVLYEWNKINCPRCGEFRINVDAIEMLSAKLKGAERKVANASGWVREHQNEPIDLNVVERLLNLPTPSVTEKGLRLLNYLEKNTSFLGQKLKSEECFLAIASVINREELNYIFDYLKANNYIEFHKGGLFGADNIYVTHAGFAYLDKIKYSNADSQIGFCAMWFDDSVSHLWDKAIEPSISSAGYQPLRIDKKEHVNRIDDEIFADIRRSRFVVTDFTHGEKGVRGGVYFEAGFAQGLGLPVIWTCRKDMLSEDKLHFDIRQYNFLEWTDENLGDLKDRLQKRIEAILGRGTWKPST
jgi:hypothetical protein